MKVKDLIDKLSRFDGEAEIAVQNDNYQSMEMDFQNFGGYPTFVVFDGEDEASE